VKGEGECRLRDGAGRQADYIECWAGSGRLKERVGLCRRTGWGSLRQAQMSEDLGDHRWIYDACPEPAEGAAIIDKGPVMVPKAARPRLRLELQRLAVHRATLFPDLDGAGRYIYDKWRND
jgi:hypothetical protein